MNRSSVAAGSHEVSAVGSGSVRILDAKGRVAFSVSQESAEVELTAQEYTVVCRTGDERDRTTLTVTAE